VQISFSRHLRLRSFGVRLSNQGFKLTKNNYPILPEAELCPHHGT
jgi:hypothetical protein